MSTYASTMKRNIIMSKESLSPPLERRNELEDANRHDEKIQEWEEENLNS